MAGENCTRRRSVRTHNGTYGVQGSRPELATYAQAARAATDPVVSQANGWILDRDGTDSIITSGSRTQTFTIPWSILDRNPKVRLIKMGTAINDNNSEQEDKTLG
jgi:hypothetical protein